MTNKSTKQLPSDSFKELLITYPISKITIKMITDASGVILPTFYNHFSDKYEIFEYILQEELVHVAEELIEMGMIEEAFKVEGQNASKSTLTASLRDLIIHYFNQRDVQLGDIPILTKEGLATIYAGAIAMIIEMWLPKRDQITVEEVYRILQYISDFELL